jgi:hypothetical protein
VGFPGDCGRELKHYTAFAGIVAITDIVLQFSSPDFEEAAIW